MSTCASIFYIVARCDICKKDIISLCESLSELDIYNDICTFEPEPISEGGIVFKFPDNNSHYKSVRMFSQRRWPWLNKAVMDEWRNSDDIIYRHNDEIHLVLKAFYGANPFTLDEVKMWEDQFLKIGLVRKGNYPTKKQLICEIINRKTR